jgi:3-phosphoshikimate 1-carboxyvinyltransferase
MTMIPSARLRVRPGPPLSGSFTPPGDKSITHRAYLLGAIASGRTRVENPNPGADCEAMLGCVGLLGAGIERSAGSVAIQGRAGALAASDRVLDCGNSGTALRLLAGVLAGQPFRATLDGDASLRRRPMGRILEPLRAMGAEVEAEGDPRAAGRPPLTIRGRALTPIDHRCEVASAQVASCVLLAGLFARGRTSVTLPRPARDHTERMLAAFGVPVAVATAAGAHTLAVNGPAVPRGMPVRVPGDFSAAAFFLAAAAASPGAVVTARDVNLNPTRTGLLAVLERMGARVERGRVREESGEPVGDVTVRGPGALSATAIEPEELPSLIDEIPAWAVAASAARGTSRLSGAAELRVKESDRLSALAHTLGLLGVAVEERPDGLIVTGGRIRGATVPARDDHRIAMALALIGARAEGPVTVEEAGGIPTSFPAFGATLASLGGVVEEVPVESGR